MCQPHWEVTPESISCQMQECHSRGMFKQATWIQLFHKTLSYFMALQRQGCTGPLFERTYFTVEEQEEKREALELQARQWRGHIPKEACDGRLLYKFRPDGRPYIW